MKTYVKKLLSILTALTLLVSLVLPAGVIPTFASTEDDPVVTEIDFTSGEAYYIGGYGHCVYRDTGNTTDPYVVKLEYFLTEVPFNLCLVNGVDNGGKVESGDNYFRVGHHTMEVAFTYNGTYVPLIQNGDQDGGDRNVGGAGKLYIWNFSITQGGEKILPVGDLYGEPTATVSSDKTLSQYDWAATLDTDEPVTLFNFTDKTQFGIGKYTVNTTAEKYWQVEFDYYLPEATSQLSYACATGNDPEILSGSRTMPTTKGHHHVSFTGYKNEHFYPRFNAAQGTQLYVWNYSVKLISGGVELPYTYESAKTEVYSYFGEYDGMLNSYGWVKYVGSPTVTEISAPASVTSGDYSWTPSNANFYFNGVSEATAYTVSFDYYLPKDATTLLVDSVSGHTSTVSGGTFDKTAGHHTFSWTAYVNPAMVSDGQFVPYIQADYLTTIYLWNWSVKQNGVELTGQNKNWTPSTYGTVGDPLVDYAWYSYMDDPFVTEITIPTKGDMAVNDWSPKPAWYYGGNSAQTPFTVSFDYYLPETIGGIRMYSVSDGMTTVRGGTLSRFEGHHHAEWVTYHAASGQLVFAIEAPVNARIYIWNFSVKVNGAEVVPTDKSGEWNGATNGTVGQQLGAYDWYKYMDDSIPMSMAVATMPNKTTYEKGEQFVADGLSLSVTDNYGETYIVTDGYQVSGFDSATAGEKTVTVTYKGFTATFTVTVNEAALTSIAINSLPSKLTYEIGESLDTAGLSLTLKYSDGSATTVTEGFTISGFDSATLGEKTVTVSYGGQSTTFTVTVMAPEPVVTEIDFSTGNAWTENVYKKSDVNTSNPYVVTFEYFLASNATVTFDSVAGNIGTQAGSSSTALQVGHHTFKGIYAPSAGDNCLAPRLMSSDTSLTLYIWNYSITVGGQTITRSEPGTDHTTATARTGNRLSTYDWYKYMDDPFVTEITIPTKGDMAVNDWSPKPAWYYGGNSAQTPFTVSFDYYLPETIGGIRMYSVSDGMTTVRGGTLSRFEGHHHAEWVTYHAASGQLVFAIEAPVNARIYIWNFSVKVNGAEVVPTDKSGEWNGATNGVGGTFLSTYPWYATMDEEIPQHLEVLAAPNKTEYELGEELDLDGLVVKYVTNYNETVVTDECEVSGFDSTTSGTKTITLSYGGVSATFAVTVNEPKILTGISVDTMPNKVNYKKGDSFVSDGLVIALNYSNGSSDRITQGFTFSGFESESWGEKIITVTYEDFTTTFTVNVVEPIVTEISAPSSVTSGTYRWTPGASNFYQGGVDASTAYTVTFDYFIPETVSTLSFGSVSGFTDGYVSGSNEMKKYPGHHKFEWTFYISGANFDTGQFVPFIELGYEDTIYIWNWSVKQNGVELAPYDGNCNASGNPDMTYGKVGDNLTSYAWYPTMNDFEPPVYANFFDFDGANFDSATFMSGENTTYKTLFYAESFRTGSYKGAFKLVFDYYMPEQFIVYVNNSNITSSHIADDATGTAYLQQGRHTFSATLDTADYTSSGSNTIFGLNSIYQYWLDVNSDGVQDGAVNGVSILPKDLYVWNWRLETLDGDVIVEGFKNTYKGAGASCLVSKEVDINEIETVTKNEVLELDFTATPKPDDDDFTTGVYSMYYPVKINLETGSADIEYTISFDYFLAEANKNFNVGLNYYTNADGGTSLRNVAPGENGDYDLEVGRHKFVATLRGDQISAGLTDLYIACGVSTMESAGKLNIWNLSLTCTKGSEALKANGNFFDNNFFYVVTNSSSLPAGRRPSVNVTNGLNVEAVKPEKELDMVGTQMRKDYALRFVAAIKGANIVRNPDGTADYTNATIVIDGVTYKVTNAGILFGRDVRIGSVLKGAPDAVMTLENIGKTIMNIPAKKLQSEQHHDRYLGKDVQGVVFTGVITDLPRANWDESLSARPYIKYLDENGDVQVFYGEVISRSMSKTMSVLEDEEMVSVDASVETRVEAMKESVLNAPNTTFSASTTYYVDSVNGNDDNDGESPETAWKTVKKVNAWVDANRTSNNTVAVLFKRGCVFRDAFVNAKSYTYYGAYGTGAKPVLTSSAMNYADAASLAAARLSWQKVDGFENRWQLVGLGDYLEPNNSRNSSWGNHVGMVYLINYVNGEEVVKPLTMSNVSTIYDEYEFYQSIDRTFTDEAETKVDTANIQLGDLFICLPEGVKPTDYPCIEIATTGSLFTAEQTSGYSDSRYNDHFYGCTIDNLAIKYVGTHGVSFNSTVDTKPINNITITNCEIGWIGGAFQSGEDKKVRLGNGIEFYGAHNTGSDRYFDGDLVTTVQNNWIYQCYDAGYSNQGGHNIAAHISVTENLIEYCVYSIEIWMDKSTGLIKDCHYEYNIMRFAGYGLEANNRANYYGSQVAISHVNFMFSAQPCENVTVNNNVFDTSLVSLICVAYPNAQDYQNYYENNEDKGPSKNTENDVKGTAYKSDYKGPEIKDNAYYQGYGKQSILATCGVKIDDTDNEWVFKDIHGSGSQAEMEASVAAIGDTTATKVVFYK